MNKTKLLLYIILNLICYSMLAASDFIFLQNTKETVYCSPTVNIAVFPSSEKQFAIKFDCINSNTIVGNCMRFVKSPNWKPNYTGGMFPAKITVPTIFRVVCISSQKGDAGTSQYIQKLFLVDSNKNEEYIGTFSVSITGEVTGNSMLWYKLTVNFDILPKFTVQHQIIEHKDTINFVIEEI